MKQCLQAVDTVEIKETATRTTCTGIFTCIHLLNAFSSMRLPHLRT